MTRPILIIVTLACLCRPVSANVDAALNVTVDPRIELLAAIQLISGYGERTGLITRYDVAYKRTVAERFGEFKDHRAVTLFDQMSRRGFSYDGPVTAVLHLGPPPELEVATPLSEYVCRRAGSREALLEFIDAMRDFAIVSDFQAFFDEHKQFYAGLVDGIRPKLAGIDPSMLEEYYGARQHSYNIILGPLLHSGGFGPRLAREDGAYDIYGAIGPQGAADGAPVFGDAESFQYLVWHEFSHSFVNPVVDAFGEQIDAYAHLFQPLQSGMKPQGYGQWRTCVYEHMVRAATSRFTARELGAEEGRKAIDHEASRKFVYVQALCDKLKQYEDQRDRYPSYRDFFPELIEVFEQAAAENPERPTGDLAAPKIISSWPAAGAIEVDPTLAELRVEFDQDMKPGGFSFIQRDAESYPQTTGLPRWESPRVCVLPVKLAPGRSYWIGVNREPFTNFVGVNGAVAETFILEFTTSTE